MGATHSHERLEPAIPATPAPGEPGALVADRYRLTARIHTGSTGTLYRAEDLAFSRPVALRLLSPELSRDEAVLTRLQARLQASAAMARDDLAASGDIVELTDLGRSDGGLVFVVTDYIAGESLAAQLAREGPLPWRTLRPLMVRACQIIHLSHQHGLLRLDLQTRHLFPIRDKTRTSTLKILSPGIGDVFGDSLWSRLDPAAAAAHLRYAAPEQLTGGTIDARTDIYALGVIMFELLCGRVPFPDTRPAYVCARHLLEPPPPFPAGVRARIPEAVIGIVTRALAKAPEDRWPTMRALANAMAAIDFGPCDASGVLEVVDVEPVEPPHPAASASMRIDPAALHAPSPVRPPTLPPSAGMMASAEFSAVAAARNAPAPWYSLPQDGDGGSSSRMAWDEILAAAEEAVAAVASAAERSSGTAGDSGVFLPERLLHTGEATTASTTQGRRDLADELVMPGNLVRPEAPPSPARPPTSATARTEPVASDSATVLPAVLILGTTTPWRPAPEPAASETLEIATASADAEPTPSDSDSSLPTSVDRSGTLWPLPAASQISPRPANGRPLVWAAAALLAFGGTAAGVRLFGPHEAATPVVAAVQPVQPAPAPAHAGGAVPASAARGLAPRESSEPHDLSARTAAGDDADLSSGSGAAAQWREPAVGARPAAPAAPAADLADETASKSTARTPGRAAAPAPAKTSATATAAATKPAAAPHDPAVPEGGPRKPIPGTHVPDAGHELAAPIDHDPLTAAGLLERAQQAAGRGERSVALSLAMQSYHAQPNSGALRLAGEQACKLGDADKARWALQHLAADERGPVETACETAGLALE